MDVRERRPIEAPPEEYAGHALGEWTATEFQVAHLLELAERIRVSRECAYLAGYAAGWADCIKYDRMIDECSASETEAP